MPTAAENPNWMPSLGLNLAEITDWSPELPFIDIFRMSRDWIPQRQHEEDWTDNEWDTGDAGSLDLDSDGWLVSLPADDSDQDFDSVGTLMLRDMAGNFKGGIYHVFYEGEGTLSFGFAATVVTAEEGHYVIDVDPENDGGIYMRIDATDPNGTGDYLRDFHVVHEDHLELFRAGVTFNPDFVATVQDMAVLRYMGWLDVNEEIWNAGDDLDSQWDERITTSSARGMSLEHMVELANLTGTDMWVNIPHDASDDYVRHMAEIIANGLRSDLKVYVEYSNEVWNWSFGQTHYAEAQSEALFGADVVGGFMQYYGVRSMQVIEVFEQVFDDRAGDILGVFASQWGWPGLEQLGLQAEDWVAGGGVAPIESGVFDVYAVGAYFGGNIGNSINADVVREWMELGGEGLELAFQELAHGGLLPEGDESLDAWQERLDYHAEIAATYGLELAAYEGGQHIVGDWQTRQDPELRAFYKALTDDPRLTELYADMMAAWREAGGTVFNHFVDIDTGGAHGSWGIRENLFENTPRSDFLDNYNAENSMWWQDDRASSDFQGALYASGTGGEDKIVGGAFDDVLQGGNGDDTLSGEEGDDVLIGGGGEDYLEGGAGDDFLSLESGVAHGGDGSDTLSLRHDFDDYEVRVDGGWLVLSLEGQEIRYQGMEFILEGDGDLIEAPQVIAAPSEMSGGDIDDLLVGGAGDDWIHGGGGTDILIGAGGDDTLDGGGGDGDTAAYWYTASGIHVDLGQGLALDDGLGGTDILINIDGIQGSMFNDTILGGDSDDRLWGMEGNDILNGGDGADILVAKSGNDTLTGGEGQDIFMFFEMSTGSHTVTDFTSGDDQLIAFGYSSGDLLSSATQHDNDILFDLGALQITLVGVVLADLSESDLAWWQ